MSHRPWEAIHSTGLDPNRTIPNIGVARRDGSCHECGPVRHDEWSDLVDWEQWVAWTDIDTSVSVAVVVVVVAAFHGERKRLGSMPCL